MDPPLSDAVWETTARQLAKSEWKFRVASKIHVILAGLASRNLKTLATITGYSFIILFALILKVITSICNETIFHLIVKSTLAKLCGVGIVYLFFLLTEMKCHDSY
jgi:hypothetical protein